MTASSVNTPTSLPSPVPCRVCDGPCVLSGKRLKVSLDLYGTFGFNTMFQVDFTGTGNFGYADWMEPGSPMEGFELTYTDPSLVTVSNNNCECMHVRDCECMHLRLHASFSVVLAELHSKSLTRR